MNNPTISLSDNSFINIEKRLLTIQQVADILQLTRISHKLSERSSLV